jgi:methionyl-tRNA formyltransferase
MRIVFMGTPEFAVATLRMLVENGCEVVGVVTATDKLGGRGKQQLIQSAVKKYAVEKGLRVLQPEKLRAPEFLEELASLKAELQVVVAFRMLPEVVWNMPPMGTINLHGSLLPKYRGAAPINWAIMQGEKETGLTTFFLQHEIDTGELLLQHTLPISPDETAGELHDRMMEAGAELVLKTVRVIESGQYQTKPQYNEAATHAPKIFRETCLINFDQTAASAHNFVRGLSPHPSAWMLMPNDGSELKILRTQKPDGSVPHIPKGKLQPFGKNQLLLGFEDAPLEILELKPAGKKAMRTTDFLNGHRFLFEK